MKSQCFNLYVCILQVRRNWLKNCIYILYYFLILYNITKVTLSGWTRTANFRYCFLMSSSVASFGTPRILLKGSRHCTAYSVKDGANIVILWNSIKHGSMRTITVPCLTLKPEKTLNQEKKWGRGWGNTSLYSIWVHAPKQEIIWSGTGSVFWGPSDTPSRE